MTSLVAYSILVTLLLALFLLAFLFAGYVVSEWLWRRLSDDADERGPAEKLASWGTVFVTLTVAGTWLVAAPRVMTAASLVAVAVATAAGAGWLAHRMGLFAKLQELNKEYAFGPVVPSLVAGVALLPWLYFVMWRGWLLPVGNHDGLAYHMPRAVMIRNAHGFAAFDGPHYQIASWPANYEMMLSDFMILAGTDRYCAWVSTIFYVLFLVYSAALAERWWGKGLHAWVVALVAGATPIALLHAGAHKTDFMMVTMTLGAAIWAGRWAAKGKIAPLVLGLACVCVAVGTKVSGPLLGFSVIPVGLWWLKRDAQWRTVRAKHVGLLVAGGVVAALLLGAIPYIRNVLTIGGLHPKMAGGPFGEGYWELDNLWRFPAMAWLVPFSDRPFGVWVPWLHQYWFWPRYNLFVSHFGELFSAVVVALPFAIYRYRKQGSEEGRNIERWATSFVLLLMFALILPIKLRPIGFFATFVRFTFFIVPAGVAWTIAPLVRELEGRVRRSTFVTYPALAAAILFFWSQAYTYGTKDEYFPIEYVLDVDRNPELERQIFVRRNRAASFVDKVAGPTDTIAFDGVTDVWLYPAYGKDLTRTLVFLHPEPGKPVVVPDEVRWVCIDRNWNVFWGHPDLKTFGDLKYLEKGTPTDLDMQVFRQLKADPKWMLVYRDRHHQQAVFLRKDMAGDLLPPPAEDKPAPAESDSAR